MQVWRQKCTPPSYLRPEGLVVKVMLLQALLAEEHIKASCPLKLFDIDKE
jgi:hypothetical protein